jgi:hypothetical protein
MTWGIVIVLAVGLLTLVIVRLVLYAGPVIEVFLERRAWRKFEERLAFDEWVIKNRDEQERGYREARERLLEEKMRKEGTGEKEHSVRLLQDARSLGRSFAEPLRRLTAECRLR